MNVSETFQRRTRRHHVHSGTLFLMALRMEQMTVVLGKLAFCEVTEISSGGKILGQQREGQSLFRRKRPSLSCQTRDRTAVWPWPRSEAQRGVEKRLPEKCLMSRWLCYVYAECHQEEVEASLDIKDVIYQSSCFSKTIIMSITPTGWHRTRILNSTLFSTRLFRTCFSIEW